MSGHGLGTAKAVFLRPVQSRAHKLIGVHGIVGAGGHQLGNHLVRPARRECPEVNGLPDIGRVHIFRSTNLAQVTLGNLVAHNQVEMNRRLTFVAFLSEHDAQRITMLRQTPEAAPEAAPA
jgi:hypothetical protein